jgi:chitin synthase
LCCRTDSNRYSLTSNSDTTHHTPPNFDATTVDTANFTARPRHDSNTLLMLPAPLAVNRGMMSSTSTVGMSRSSEDNYLSDSGSGSNQRLIPSPQSLDQDSYESGVNQRLISPTSPYESPVPRLPPVNTRRVPSPQPSPDNPFRQVTTSPTTHDEQQPYTPDFSEEGNPGRGAGRGVRLTDSGPVPGPDGVRRVSRPSGRRPTSQVPAQNRYSRSSVAYSLPPGAAPPQPNYGGSAH